MEDGLGRSDFFSWQDFRTYLDAWCQVRKAAFCVRHCVLLNDEDVRREVAQALKYSSVDMVCGNCPARKCCPAIIKLKLGPWKDRLIVARASLQHNHSLVATPQVQEAKRSRLLHPLPLANDVSKKFLDTHDLKRLLRSPPGSFIDGVQVLKDLDALFASDPKAKVKLVYMEDKLLVKSIFVMVSYMQEVAQLFPGSLYVDFLPGFSKDFDLFTVLCEEDVSCWKICAYCIARKGTSGTLRFILVSIMQSIPKMNTQVKHLTVSPEIQDPLDLEALLPHAAMRYCMPLVLDILYQRIAYLDSTTEDQIKTLLHVLANTDSPEAYYQCLNDLKGVCPAEVYQFYYDTWHPRRKMWVKEDERSQTMEANIHALVRWKHQAVTSQLGDSPTLDHCLQVLLSDSETTFNLVEFSPLPQPEEMLEPTQQHGLDGNNETGAVKNEKVPVVEEEAAADEAFTLMMSDESDIDEDQVSDGAAKEQLEQCEFYSWVDFCSFLDAWCLERKTRFAVRQSIPLSAEKVGAHIARSLKYDTVTLGCQGTNITTRKKCPASIQLKLGPLNDKLVVSKTLLCHNHDLQEQNLSAQGTVCRMSNANQVTGLALDISRKFLEWSDLSRLLRFHLIPFEEHSEVLKELDSLFVSDPGAKVKLVFLEDKLQVKHIFIMTSQMQEVVQAFPGQLYVDLLPCFHPDFDLYTFLCDKENYCWEVCAYCISRREMPDTLRFIMVSIMQSISKMSAHVKTVTLDPDIRHPQVLESLVPNASIKYCTQLVLDRLYCKIAHLDSVVEAKIKKCLLALAYANASNIYSRCLNDLRAICPEDIFNYYFTTWDSCWKLWCRVDDSSQDGENRICDFLKAMHERFIAQRSSSLYSCLHMVLRDCGSVSTSSIQEINVNNASLLRTDEDNSGQHSSLNEADRDPQMESNAPEEFQTDGHQSLSFQESYQEAHPLSSQEPYFQPPLEAYPILSGEPESLHDRETPHPYAEPDLPGHEVGQLFSEEQIPFPDKEPPLPNNKHEPYLLDKRACHSDLHPPLFANGLPKLPSEPPHLPPEEQFTVPLEQEPHLTPCEKPNFLSDEELNLPLDEEPPLLYHKDHQPLTEETQLFHHMEPQLLTCQNLQPQNYQESLTPINQELLPRTLKMPESPLCTQTHQDDLPNQESSTSPYQEPPAGPNLTTTTTHQIATVTSDIPLDGKEFHSWDELCSFLEDCCEEKFLIQVSEFIEEEELCQMQLGQKLVQSLKYSSVELSCSRNNCPAFIKLKLGPQKDRLVVVESSFHHNHDLPDSDNPPPSKKSKMASQVGLPAHTANNISRKFLEPEDIVSLLRFRSGAFEDRTQVLSELHSLFTSDSKARIKLVFVEDKLLVKSIFIMTSWMQDIAQAFSGRLYVDFFPEFSPGFDLYTLLCDQDNYGWNVCAHCIAKKNLSDILRFLLVSTFQTIPSMNSKVKRLTVNPGIPVPWGLEAVLPDALMSYCVPSLLEYLCQKIKPCDVALEEQVKGCLSNIVQTRSVKVYEKCLNDLKVLCSSDVFQYYSKTWHPRRNQWLLRGDGPEEAERRASEFVENMQRSFVSQMGPSPSLHQCLHVVLNENHAERSRKPPQLEKMDMSDSYCSVQEMNIAEHVEHL